jgi:uncharacterized cysteine cluster protein YcgN (CxxCxxCC family)
LEWWHPLKSGDPDTVHQAGVSARHKAVSGQGLIATVDDIEVDV